MKQYIISSSFDKIDDKTRKDIDEQILNNIDKDDIIIANELLAKEELFDVIVKNDIIDKKVKYSGIRKSQLIDFIHHIVYESKSTKAIPYFIVHKEKL